MRTRLCYLGLVLIPLFAYWPALFTEYGTPEDFVRLQLVADTPASGQQGILHSALVEMSFLPVDGVAQLVIVRVLALGLVILAGVALWQMLERGGWSDIDAGFIAAGLGLLPAAQLIVAWGAAWPAAMAALLALAGFAAAESELEQGGAKRFIAMFGAVLLYFAAAMCNLATATIALVPLAALGLVRPLRQLAETRRWFLRHAALLAAGLIGALLLERWMLADAGIDDHTTVVQRLADLFLHALPEGGALFFAASTTAQRGLAAVLTAAVAFGVVSLVRRAVAQDERTAGVWRLAVAGALAVFAAFALLMPHWRGSPLQFWTVSGLGLVAVAGAWRLICAQSPKRQWWHGAVLGGVIALGVFVAGGQAHQRLAVPLWAEWTSLRTQVMRAHFAGEMTVELKLPEAAVRTGQLPEAGFAPRVAADAAAAEAMFRAALRERFSAGLPKGVNITVRTQPRDGVAPTLVFDLSEPGNE